MQAAPENFEPMRSRRRGVANGFTLIELMISIALVLILILGINQVFKIASDTVNAGQSQSSANRYNRAVQGVLYPDFQNAVVTGAPCFIIRSNYLPAFRNRPDELADRDGNPLTVDNDGNNKESDPIDKVPATAIHSRNHRLDELMFFASGRFQRQTGSGGSLSGFGSSNEAFVYYGHLQLPNNQVPPFYYNPGKYASNDGAPEGGGGGNGGVNGNNNNQYATQWSLGRVPILLAGLTPDPNSTFIGQTAGNNLSPLAGNSETFQTPKKQIQWSTCDVAQTTMADYRDKLNDPKNWASGIGWWDTVAGVRFWANPIPSRPLTADKVARTTPIFVEGCTQFIVEYTGDFLAQDTNPLLPSGTANPRYGQITGHAFQSTPLTDGVTDFVVVKTPSGPVRKTRWYGMPRNVDNTDDVRNGRPSITGGKGQNNTNAIVDVVPLRDVVATLGVNSPPPSIEPMIDDAKMLPMASDYAAITVPPNPRYAAAWGPGDLSRGSPRRPTMIRITLVVDDPSGRMTEGQSYEYVFDLK